MRTAALVLLIAAGCRGNPPRAAAPPDPAALDRQGEAELLAGRLDEAERSFRAALAIDAGFAPAHDGLAMIRFHRGDAAGGIAELEAGLAIEPGDDPFPRIRLLEQLAWAQMLEGREDDALAANAAAVVAQGLESEAATAGVTHLGRARLFMLTGRWDRAIEAATAARAGDVPGYVGWVSHAVEASARARSGDVEGGQRALDVLVGELGDGHPLALDPRFDLAIARGDLDGAAAVLALLDDSDPYAAERARLALAEALTANGRGGEAAPHLERLATRYLRSVGSARIRRIAADLAGR